MLVPSSWDIDIYLREISPEAQNILRTTNAVKYHSFFLWIINTLIFEISSFVAIIVWLKGFTDKQQCKNAELCSDKF